MTSVKNLETFFYIYELYRVHVALKCVVVIICAPVILSEADVFRFSLCVCVRLSVRKLNKNSAVADMATPSDASRISLSSAVYLF